MRQDVYLLENIINTTKKNTETAIDPSNEVGLKLSTEKIEYVL
jgi:hypothetical protein